MVHVNQVEPSIGLSIGYQYFWDQQNTVLFSYSVQLSKSSHQKLKLMAELYTLPITLLDNRARPTYQWDDIIVRYWLMTDISVLVYMLSDIRCYENSFFRDHHAEDYAWGHL